MTIYFDINKNAYGFKIDNFVTTIDDETWTKYAGTDKWDIIDGKFIDITDSDEYKAKVLQKETEAKKEDLQNQIEELDRKRVRAIAEPEVKDSTTGETWLEYYTSEVKDLRTQLSSL